VKRNLTDQEIWERVREIIVKRKLVPEKYYAFSLTKLGYLVFQTFDSNDLKGVNKILAHILKKHGIRIIFRKDGRYALVHEDLVKRLEAKEREREPFDLLVIP